MSQRIVAFLAVFVALQLSWQLLRGSPVEYAVVHHGTVRPAAYLIDRISPQVRAHAVDFSVRARGGGLNVVNGCEGLDAVCLLVAAFAAAGLPLATALFATSLGVAMVVVVNQLRIVALFFAYRRDPALFDALHSAVAPLAMVLFVACYFHAWLSYSRDHAAAAA